MQLQSRARSKKPFGPKSDGIFSRIPNLIDAFFCGNRDRQQQLSSSDIFGCSASVSFLVRCHVYPMSDVRCPRIDDSHNRQQQLTLTYLTVFYLEMNRKQLAPSWNRSKGPKECGWGKTETNRQYLGPNDSHLAFIQGMNSFTPSACRSGILKFWYPRRFHQTLTTISLRPPLVNKRNCFFFLLLSFLIPTLFDVSVLCLPLIPSAPSPIDCFLGIISSPFSLTFTFMSGFPSLRKGTISRNIRSCRRPVLL